MVACCAGQRGRTREAVSILSSPPSPAPGAGHALIDCEFVNDQYCSPWDGDDWTTCWSESTQRTATCLCDGTAHWFCKM